MTRLWIPTAWLDEMVTGMSEAPNVFLKRTPEGVLQLHPIDEPDDPEAGPDWRIKTLEPGEIVELSFTENFGEGTLTVREDGTWACDREFPADATHYWLPYDPSTMTESIASLVSGGDLDPEPLEAGTYTIGAYLWSDPIKHQVRIRDTGEAEFQQVGSA